MHKSCFHTDKLYTFTPFFIYIQLLSYSHIYFSKLELLWTLCFFCIFSKRKKNMFCIQGKLCFSWLLLLFLMHCECCFLWWVFFLHVYTFFLLVVYTILLFPALSCELVTNPVLESWALDLERYDWIVHRGGIYFPAKSSQSLQRKKKRRGPKRPGWPWRLLTALRPIAACRQQQISKLPGRLRAAEQPRRVLTLRFPSGEERAACLPRRRHDALLAGCFLHGRHWWAVKRPRHR